MADHVIEAAEKQQIRKRTAKELVQDLAKRNKPTDDEEDPEHVICLICSEAWTSVGEHRLVSLKCGHLFGKSCITRWLIQKSSSVSGAKSAVCPTCKKTAKTSEIRIVLPINISVRDVTDIDKLKKELDSKKLQISEQKQRLENARMSLCMYSNQLERIQQF